MSVRPIGGWLPDPHDKKYPLFEQDHPAFRAAFAATAAPKTTYDIPEKVPVDDQYDVGDCVLNAWVGGLEMLLTNAGGPLVRLSRLFLYWLCREVMHTLGQDSGTYPSLGGDRIVRIGVCPETMHPYGDMKSRQMYKHPKQECYVAASDNRLLSTYRIGTAGERRLQALELVVRADHPVVFGTPVGSAVQNYQKGQVLTIPKDNGGGHSMLFTGVHYTPAGNRIWRVRNSWGRTYGDDGHLLIDDAWAAWAALDDLWVGTRMAPLVL